MFCLKLSRKAFYLQTQLFHFVGVMRLPHVTFVLITNCQLARIGITALRPSN
jgi:hypothetical protein